MRASLRTFDHTAIRGRESDLPPVLVSWKGHRTWRLEADFAYHDGTTTITVASQFIFDLASVPRPFWWAIAPFDLSIAAPLIHDFLYRNRGEPETGLEPPRRYSRREVDDLFRAIMVRENVAAWRRFLGYWAVRLFGWNAWPKPRRAGTFSGSGTS